MLSDTSKYIFDDVYNTLEVLKNKNYKMHILTSGGYDWQSLKINSSGIKKIIDDVIITENKGNIKSIDYKSSIFVDDNPKHLKIFIENNVKKVIRIKRQNLYYSKEKYDNDKLITCSSLTSALEYLK